jgi:hypothetical protein
MTKSVGLSAEIYFLNLYDTLIRKDPIMESLLSRIKRLQCYDATAFSETTFLTGTGFAGSSRANLRLLCSKTRIKYCGDLIYGWTTHLVVNDNFFNAESTSSKKMQVAAKWGVPIVRLEWLLDSIYQGEPLSIDPYLVNVSSKHTTPAAKAEVAHVNAARPTARLSSKQGSNTTPHRTPLQSVENITEQLKELAVTPIALEASKSKIVEVEAAAEENSAPSPAATEVSLLINSAGETPSVSPSRTEVPSEIALAIIESPPSMRPATELETEDEEEEEEGVGVIYSPEALPPSPVSTQPQKSSQWWNNQDDLWVPGSQPRSIQTPLPPQPSEEENDSFSFGVVATTETPPLPLPLPSLTMEENTLDPRSNNITTPMSDMTPLELQRPADMTTKTRVIDSPSSSGDDEHLIEDKNSNMQQQSCSPFGVAAAVAEIFQHGGQPEWWEEDEEEEEEECISFENNIKISCGGCTSSPAKEKENSTLGYFDEDGEEPSPRSIACSNHGGNDGEEETHSIGLQGFKGLGLPPREHHHQQEEEDCIEDCEDFSQENQIIVRARAPLPPLPPIPSGLPQAADDAVPLKVLHRAPRGSTVKARYRLVNTKTVTFAETIHLRGKQLTLNVKDKRQAIILKPTDSSSSCTTNTSSSKEKGSIDNEDEKHGIILAEPLSFYRCLGEDMQMEYHRFYTGTQAFALAEKAGVQLRLPPGFDASVELFKGTSREHADMRRVIGTVAVRKGTLGVTMLKTKSAQGGKPVHYWRCEFDADVPEVLMP